MLVSKTLLHGCDFALPLVCPLSEKCFVVKFSRKIEMVSSLHEERLNTVIRQLKSLGAKSVIDLGCGNGELLKRLAANSQFEKIVGIDISLEALRDAQTAVPQVKCLWGDFLDLEDGLDEVDAAVLLETIEHVDPRYLTKFENSVFVRFAPKFVLLTTPNSEYNCILKVPKHRFRHPDHYFEWDRQQFQKWSHGLAARNRYSVSFLDVGDRHHVYGSSTQMAVFVKGELVPKL